MKLRPILTAFAAVGLAAPAVAADLSVEVTNVAGPGGQVLVAVCTQQTFLRPDCPYSASATPIGASATVVVRGVPPGTYAIQAFHDRNGNRAVDRDFLGLPTEGIGFGNDARMLFGPPRFADAAVDVAEPDTRTSLKLRYLSGR